tara:strand:+ start:305 stop:454 length:150 start_codon:yes stop_codon:yes gene_type:complete
VKLVAITLRKRKIYEVQADTGEIEGQKQTYTYIPQEGREVMTRKNAGAL